MSNYRCIDIRNLHVAVQVQLVRKNKVTGVKSPVLGTDDVAPINGLLNSLWKSIKV
jgi:hypothetical protein